MPQSNIYYWPILRASKMYKLMKCFNKFPSLPTGVCSQVPTWHQDWFPTTKCGGSHTMSVYEDDCKNVGTRGYCHTGNRWACNTSSFPDLKWFADECPRVCYHEWVNFPQWKLPSQEMC